MANSFVLYTGDGAQTDYSVPFAYLDESHVTVDVDEVDATFTWLTSNTIRMDVAPANSTSIKVFRTTPTALQVTIPAAGVFRGADINNQTLQAIYLTEESVDALAGVLSEDDTGDFDATTRKIKNLGTPTLDADAATKLYVDTTTAADVAAAAASAVAAATAETNAETAETKAVIAQVASEASYDSFDDRYLGAKASAPTLDNDGNALITGALYWNTGTNEMNAWTGSAWQVSYNPSAGTVDSVFGRTGAIIAANNDYNFTHLAGSIAVGQIPSNIITTIKIADDNITTVKINDAAVTSAKLANMAQATIKGRASGAGTGVPVDLSAAQLKAIVGTGSSTVDGVSEHASVSEYRSNSSNVRVLESNEVWDAMAEVTLTDGASVSWDIGTGMDFVLTLGGNRAMSNPTNVVVGKKGRLRLVQDGTGSRIPTWGTNFDFAGAAGVDFTLSTGANDEDALYYDCVSATRILITLGPANIG